MKLIEIINATKSFGNQKVLDDFELIVNEKEFLTILGPSGCGKSTMLRCIAGFESLDSGKICMDGKDLSNIKSSDRDIGMIFQHSNLFPTMSVYDNIAFGLSVKKIDKRVIEDKVKEALNMVEMSGYEYKYPSQLSGGERQRVAIARTLVTNPKVLLLDEPFSAIDAKLRKNLQRSLREIHDNLGITSIFVTHDQNEAMILSDRICVMNEGKIVQAGDPSEIYTNPSEKFVASFIGNYNIIEKKDFHKLLIDFTDASSVAIRPETIKVLANDNNKSTLMEATINKLTYQSSVTIYELIVNGIKIAVESIFTDNMDYSIGDKVFIEIDKSKIIKFK